MRGGWRNPDARQCYLVKNAVGSRMQLRPLTGVPDAIRMRAIRSHVGDVIAVRRGGEPGLRLLDGRHLRLGGPEALGFFQKSGVPRAPEVGDDPVMRLTPPAVATWVIALVVGVLGIAAHERIFRMPGPGVDPFWMVTIGWVLLLIGSLVRRL